MGRRKGAKVKSRRTRPLSGWRPLTSQREARKVTSLFHKYTKELDELKSKFKGKETAEGKTERLELEEKLKGIGGRERYQEASMLLTSLNKSSSKWLFQNITKLDLRPKRGEPKLKTLEVGAINTQIVSCPWLDCTAIDLKSRHPQVKEMDFFDLPCPIEKEYDVICNAMVLNCVPEPVSRGDMLLRSLRMLRVGGLFLLVIPRRCVDAVTKHRLEAVLTKLGLEITNTNDSPKVSFFAGVKKVNCWCPLVNGEKLKLGTSSGIFSIDFDNDSMKKLCAC
uniref:Uncharacterized protein n=1 Tax=Mucochytrium quahogii TaxID=96639 RepID=A0A7S2WJ27_9STRA|mmetsp:Transcript_13929/g.22743  ORF Transcript_13929/g.22743 Transcript_13929/m.22743 type:complete len:280 (-) Transcript_13929:654-1493(-)